MGWLVAVLAGLWTGYAIVGRRWRIEPRLDAEARPGGCPELVVAVVPARNEAAEIPRTLGTLFAQEHPALHVVLVDDHSTDGTGAVARAVAAAHGAAERLTVLESAPLPTGWTGKVWAQHQGVQTAFARGAAWIWLTDADIAHARNVLTRLVGTAKRDGRDVVSVMARLRCDSAWEKLLIPAFTYFFAMIYSFHRTADDRARDAGAAGGCVLVRRALLERLGGMSVIRDAIIDDCALAAACKSAGARLWLGYDDGVVSTRGYGTLGAIWDMVARSAYTQLRANPLVLAGCVLGLAYVFLLPFVALPFGTPLVRAGALVAWAAMTWTYRPMVRHLGCAPGWAAALPVSAALYTAMTVSSALRHHRGHGAAWKGRAYGRAMPAAGAPRTPEESMPSAPSTGSTAGAP